MKTRIAELFGMLLVGDGVLSALDPKRHCLLWEIGPESCRKILNEFATHPNLTRVAGVLEAAAGVWIASQQEPPIAEKLSHPEVAFA
jgi:hypothetical protein